MNGSGTSGIVPTVDLATNNAYPVYPMMGGFGNGGFGFGGDSAIWLIVLLALIWGNNGNGFGGFGGKGIKVCDEWKHIEGFVNFYNWAMSNGYSKDLTLDRIDNEKDYCPENCRWSTLKEQSNHRTNNVFYTYKGKTKTSKQWCEEYGISQTTLNDRLKRGWTLEQALTISTKGTHRKIVDNKVIL